MLSRIYVANLPNTNIKPLVMTSRLLLISLSINPIAVILVISVHGSKIVNNPNNNAVKICTIIVFSEKRLQKYYFFLNCANFCHKYLHIWIFCCTFAVAKVYERV